MTNDDKFRFQMKVRKADLKPMLERLVDRKDISAGPPVRLAGMLAAVPAAPVAAAGVVQRIGAGIRRWIW